MNELWAIRTKLGGYWYCGAGNIDGPETPKRAQFHPVRCLFIEGNPADELHFIVECGVPAENVELVKMTVQVQ